MRSARITVRRQVHNLPTAQVDLICPKCQELERSRSRSAWNCVHVVIAVQDCVEATRPVKCCSDDWQRHIGILTSLSSLFHREAVEALEASGEPGESTVAWYRPA